MHFYEDHEAVAAMEDVPLPEEMSLDRPAERSVYKEPLGSPGLIPVHQKRAVTIGLPILEILQRLVYRLKPGYDLDKVLAMIALYQAGVPVYNYLKQLVVHLFTSQIVVPESDPVAKEILEWMSAQVMSKGSTTKAMIVTGGAMHDPTENYYRQMILPRGSQATHISDEVQCMPPIGTKIFWMGFRPFMFSRTGAFGLRPNSPSRGSGNSHQQNAIVLMTPGWSLRPLQNFVKTCHDFKLQNESGTTTIYFSGGHHVDGYGIWQSVTKAVRKLDTIDMDEDVKTDLIKDAEFYYSRESKKFYADCGIPYRRGYLFYGPPGTGKTSFSAALAGHLNCDVYMINLATGEISNGKLHRMFLALPKKCIVVIEDIDSAGIGREQGLPAGAPGGTLPPGRPSSAQPTMNPPGTSATPNASNRRRNVVTLSGLLNAIDGNASQEGRLLIMTSNNPDALDEALTRPGRIDKKIFFGKMSKSSARGIFMRLVGRAAIATGNFTLSHIGQMAAVFADKLPDNALTPAQVQNFLQSCRGDPEKALREVEAWAEKHAPKLARAEQINDTNVTAAPVAVELNEPLDRLSEEGLDFESEV